MKANHDIAPDMLANEAHFDHPFFRRFTLRERAEPLRLSETITKRYRFPTFYADVTCAQAIFLCDYARAEAAMPHPSMKPLRMPRGRSVVALACYVYRNVMNVGPYNEIAMTIPVRIEPKVNLPVLPLLVPVFEDFGYYVFDMPVTSKENCIRGNEIWGLPKVVHDIDIATVGDRCETRAVDASGNEYLTLRVPTRGRTKRFDTQAHIYSRLGRELLQSETYFDGSFEVTQNPGVLVRRGLAPKSPVLELGAGPHADRLRSLGIEPMPLQTRYAERMNACFDLPNPGFRAPFDFAG